MIAKVISGGQTGADIAGLRAAKRCGIATGGWAALGRLVESEDGKSQIAAPWLGSEYGLVECPEPGFPARRFRNANESDGTLLFWKGLTLGTKGLLNDLADLGRTSGKPLLIVYAVGFPPARDRAAMSRAILVPHTRPDQVAEWITAMGITALNIAGPRKSKAPKIEAFAEEFLVKVFTILGHAEVKGA